MQPGPPDLAQLRYMNALALFEEFVRQTAKHADAATLRGLERRFAERVQIQPSYWSQIKGRSRQIGERLARQFEHLCHKPSGWMDVAHGPPTSRATGPAPAPTSTLASAASGGVTADDSGPRDDDERFIVGLVLTYYRRHPQRARQRLLDLLGEVLAPVTPAGAGAPTSRPAAPATKTLSPAAEDAQDLWLRSQAGVAPLKKSK
jgi:hypothetical protein